MIIDQSDDPDRLLAVFQALPTLLSSTPIPTPSGPCPASDLCPGDLITTQDTDPRPLRWVAHLRARLLGSVATTEIGTGVFGATATTHVSPQMPVCFSGWRAELATGRTRALVHAADLENGLSIRRRAAGARVTLVALVMDHPTLITCNGLSLYLPGLGAPNLPAGMLPAPDPDAARQGPPEDLPFARPGQARRLTDAQPVFW